MARHGHLASQDQRAQTLGNVHRPGGGHAPSWYFGLLDPDVGDLGCLALMYGGQRVSGI